MDLRQHQIKKTRRDGVHLGFIKGKDGEEASHREQASQTAGEGLFGVGIERKDFLTLMGAATVAATVNCEVPKEVIAPLAQRGPEYRPGISVHYASICGGCSAGCGTLVKTREGRPIKLEGNPADPFTSGGLCATGQASTYDLYDPYRFRAPQKQGQDITWEAALKDVRGLLAKAKNAVLLVEPSNSPSREAIIADFAKSNKVRVVQGGLNGASFQEAAASQAAFGDATVPGYRYDKADVIVSVGKDFLGSDAHAVRNTRQFSKNRDLDKAKQFNQLVVFEPMMTVTGMAADVRAGIRPGDQAAVLLALAAELQALGLKAPIEVKDFAASKVAGDLGIDVALIRRTASALYQARGKSLVVAGDEFGDTGVDAIVIAHAINSMLGNDGKTVDGDNHAGGVNLKQARAYGKLVDDLHKGKIDLLIVNGANPAFELGAAGAGALAKAKSVVFIGEAPNETSAKSAYVLPETHFLEQWTDVQTAPGIYGLGQPTIRPLWDSRSLGDILIDLTVGGKLAGAKSYYQYLRGVWRKDILPKTVKGDFDESWKGALQSGFVAAGTGLRPSKARGFQGAKFFDKKKGGMWRAYQPGKGLRVHLYRNNLVGDGKRSNNPLAHEIPDPVSKVAWGNFVGVSRNYAAKTGLKDEQIVEVKLKNGRAIRLPLLTLPGLHPDAVAVAIGYGRSEAAGPIAAGLGANALELAAFNKKNQGPLGSGSAAELILTNDKGKLVMSQQQYVDSSDYSQTIGDMAKKRNLIPTATLAEYLAGDKKQRAAMQPKGDERGGLIVPEIKLMGEGYASSALAAGLVAGKVHNETKDWQYKGPFKWGMSIDLTKCTGCAACVTACYVENNVPTVGPKEMSLGREMAWLRIDRYFTGDDANLEVVNQPLLCQQCDNAPCETVCPVVATTHSDDGINEMTYNRCVGTRYCANNCPYKVRRFNYREYWEGHMAHPQENMLNPDVTVRNRGVMEKCNFCVQRIQEARGFAKDRGITRGGETHVPDGELQTACQQTCPADAITFGNLNDPDSAVAQAVAKEYRSQGNDRRRGYKLLEEVLSAPAVTYLAKINNKERA